MKSFTVARTRPAVHVYTLHLAVRFPLQNDFLYKFGRAASFHGILASSLLFLPAKGEFRLP